MIWTKSGSLDPPPSKNDHCDAPGRFLVTPKNAAHPFHQVANIGETNITEQELCGLSTNFHIHVSMSDLYIPRSVCHSTEWKYVVQSWEYINRSQTHECGNWDWGRAIPRKGIHKWVFLCSVALTIFAYKSTRINGAHTSSWRNSGTRLLVSQWRYVYCRGEPPRAICESYFPSTRMRGSWHGTWMYLYR